MRAVFLCLVKRWPRPQWRVFARKGSSIAKGSEIGKPDPRIRQSGLRGEPELLDSLGPLPSAVAGLDRDWTAVFFNTARYPRDLSGRARVIVNWA